MKYMVVECHPAYSVVVDENGKFIKVANLHYEVGQTIDEVFEMKLPESKPIPKIKSKWLYSIVAAAACFLFVFVPLLFMNGTTVHASVYMKINPEIRIDVDENDKVIDIEAINDDGKDLIEDYRFKDKELEDVLDELVSRAIEKDYLKENGKITLTLDTDDGEWVISHSDSLDSHLNSYLTDKMPQVTVEVNDKNVSEDSSLILEESSEISDIVSESPDVSIDDDFEEDESDDIDDDESDDIDDDESDDIDDDESDDIDDDRDDDDIDDDRDDDDDRDNDRDDDDDDRDDDDIDDDRDDDDDDDDRDDD